MSFVRYDSTRAKTDTFLVVGCFKKCIYTTLMPRRRSALRSHAGFNCRSGFGFPLVPPSSQKRCFRCHLRIIHTMCGFLPHNKRGDTTGMSRAASRMQHLHRACITCITMNHPHQTCITCINPAASPASTLLHHLHQPCITRKRLHQPCISRARAASRAPGN